MILTCSRCTTQFSINAAALGARGRKVKCSRCSHSWFQAPETPPPPAAPSIEAIMPEPVRVKTPAPVVAIKKSASPALKIATNIMAVFALLSGIMVALPMVKMPAVARMANAFGLADQKGFSLYNVAINKIPSSGGKMTIAFAGALKNNTDATRAPIPVTIVLYDRSNRQVRALDYQFSAAQIEAGKTLAFDPKVHNIPDSLSRVVLELGSPVEQLFR